ncbi:response regulator [Starkeya sp. ORNL1]|uniref:response regulator n=1 Tax=Starkeya sp. ORNL1 TaxID=2709380 RepID=UPI0014638038|nr:response regulator [Starkeya sp. ORNL1]QJP13252.1 response regulator [Starkeya sp. ORNL1]
MADAVGKRVLVIDDASLVRRYYREALEHGGFEVDEALNGLEAMEKLLLAEVDLLVVDVNMPRMDGLTFLKVLRRQESSIASIPALITSTEAAPEDIEAAREAGANFYLVKPLSQEGLLHYARMLCGVPS